MQYQAEQAALIVTVAVLGSPLLPLRGAHSPQYAATAAAHSVETQILMVNLVVTLLLLPPKCCIELWGGNASACQRHGISATQLIPCP